MDVVKNGETLVQEHPIGLVFMVWPILSLRLAVVLLPSGDMVFAVLEELLELFGSGHMGMERGQFFEVRLEKLVPYELRALSQGNRLPIYCNFCRSFAPIQYVWICFLETLSVRLGPRSL